MRLPHPIIGLLIAAAVLLDVCLWIATSSQHWPALSLLTLWTLLFSQASLLATWAAIGRGALFVRTVVAAAGIIILDLAAIQTGVTPQEVALLFAEQSMIVFVPLLAMRLAGYRVETVEERDNANELLTGRPWQFSISNILQTTAVVGTLTALAMRITVSGEIAWLATWLAGSFAAPVPVIVWAILTVGNPVPRVVIAVTISLIAAGSLLIWWPDDSWQFATQCLAQHLLVGLALLAVRVAGYLFVRRRGLATQSVAAVRSHAERGNEES